MCCDRKGQLSCYSLNQPHMSKDKARQKSLPCRLPGMGHSCHISQIHAFSTWAAILHRLAAKDKPEFEFAKHSLKNVFCINDVKMFFPNA